MISKFCVFLLLLFWAPLAFSQADVVFPDGDATWSVTFERVKSDALPKTAAAEQPAEINKIDVVRKGNLRRDTIKWSDGNSTQYWWIQIPPVVLYENKKDGTIESAKAGYVKDRLLDASSFAWVNPSTFVDERPFRKIPCKYYEMQVVDRTEDPKMFRAWIDAKTGKPVALRTGIDDMVFEFDTGDLSSPLVIPPKFEDLLKKIVTANTPPVRLNRN